MMHGLLKKLEQNPRMATLVQFVKFGLVGISNTLISYGVEMLVYYVLSPYILGGERGQTRIVIASVLSFFVSVTNSYYWNSRYVFGKDERKTVTQHLCSYLKTTACYSITGLILAPLMKMWLSHINVPYWLASLGTLAVTIPLNYILNKCWAFAKK